jgi:hypothetical protein
MAKFKPARGRKSAPPATRPQAVGCVIIMLALFAFVYVVLYYAIKQG